MNFLLCTITDNTMQKIFLYNQFFIPVYPHRHSKIFHDFYIYGRLYGSCLLVHILNGDVVDIVQNNVISYVILLFFGDFYVFLHIFIDFAVGLSPY